MMLFRTIIADEIEFSFMLEFKLASDNETPSCSHTRLVLRIFEKSHSINGTSEVDKVLEHKHSVPDFFFGSQQHRNHVKRLILRSQNWPDDVDLESSLDMAFSDAISKLEYRARFCPPCLWNRVPTIIFDMIKCVYEEYDDDDEEEEEVDMAVEQSMLAAPRTKPATKESIKELKKVKLEKNNTEQCMICMEQLLSISETEADDENEIISMPCSHLFHGGCIQQWLDTSHQCPLCRFPMPTYW